MRRPGLKGLPKGNGRYIYAYCHVRTKQVVYSLTQTLDNYRALKQLPDLGANNKDAVLRKDLWKPLYTLCLPEGDDGRAQGLAAFQRLREWRKLHELNWEMPESLKMPYTEEHLDEKFKGRLENRNGNKTEHPHDLAKRAKKRMRVRLIQDQKANSIADLAAVLLGQEDLAAEKTQWKAVKRAEERAREVEEMRYLAEQAKQGGIEKLEAEIRDLEKRLEKVLAGEEDVEGFKRTRLRREIQSLELKQVRMEFAFRAVTRAEREAQRVKVHVSEHSAQIKVAREFAELAETDVETEAAGYEAKVTELKAESASNGEKEPIVADPEQGVEARERARFDHQARLHQIQLARAKKGGSTFDGNWLPAVDDLQKHLLDYKMKLAKDTNEQMRQKVMDRIEAEAAQWRALRAQPDFVVESNLYEGSKAARAHELRYLAEIADKTALQRIRSRIQKRQNLLDNGAGPEREATQAVLNRLRITERYMQLAATAAAKNISTDMMAEANAIRTSVFEFAVRRAKENILTAQRAKKPNEFLQPLERELVEAQEVLQEVRDTGATTAERNAAKRRQRLADKVQAERASRPELFSSKLEPMEEAQRDSEESTEANEAAVPEQSAVSPEQSAAASTGIGWASRLPSFPGHTKEPLPKRFKKEVKQRSLTAPIYSTEGVTIKWQNIFDAEFAEKWPANVQHQRMGWTRFTAPHARAAPIDDLAEHTVREGRRSKQYALSAPLPGTAAAEEEPASQIEEGESYAEGDKALEAEAEQRDTIVRVAKSQILRKVKELAEQQARNERRSKRYHNDAVKAERLGKEVEPMEEYFAQLRGRAQGSESSVEDNHPSYESVQA
ncbi:hypothetical protein EJ03DRAFT_324187 [Teratosphaeria nubilosa]|uniref:Large ribosomal subunit protein mL67 n=1 Tax=Teratosphaeria nubilosa TaxID=161662 RepID=A0A6G1LJJ6_9PEZI|nr:hypothetical protein EJ03DRAFT_324187 [Teratosphaeria nubilosa]